MRNVNLFLLGIGIIVCSTENHENSNKRGVWRGHVNAEMHCLMQHVVDMICSKRFPIEGIC